jgi:hypothetical protein
MKTIELVIEPNGELRIEAMGYHGPDCAKATAFLETALGKIAGRRPKPEAFRKVRPRQEVKV